MPTEPQPMRQVSYPSTLIWSQPLEEEASVFIRVLHKVELRVTDLFRVPRLELEPSSFVQIRPELDPQARWRQGASSGLEWPPHPGKKWAQCRC